jgi:hypothetical protein
MSSRERWVIYPLLFFAFCLAARDQFPYLRPEVVDVPRLSCRVIDAKLIDAEKIVTADLSAHSIEGQQIIEGNMSRLNTVDTGDLVCNRLVVKSVTGRLVAELGRAENGAGRLAICSADNNRAIVLAADEEVGQIESRHHAGMRVLIHATKDGGAIYAVDADDRTIARVDLRPAETGPTDPPGDDAGAKSDPEKADTGPDRPKRASPG